MLVKLFQIIFGKFIGLDLIEPEKKKKVAKAALFVVKELIEAAARGATDEEVQDIALKFKKEF